jgi:hypothetical protein
MVSIFIYLAIGLGTLLILSNSAFLWLNGSIAGSGISEGGELKKYKYLKKLKSKTFIKNFFSRNKNFFFERKDRFEKDIKNITWTQKGFFSQEYSFEMLYLF